MTQPYFNHRSEIDVNTCKQEYRLLWGQRTKLWNFAFQAAFPLQSKTASEQFTWWKEVRCSVHNPSIKWRLIVFWHNCWLFAIPIACHACAFTALGTKPRDTDYLLMALHHCRIDTVFEKTFLTWIYCQTDLSCFVAREKLLRTKFSSLRILWALPNTDLLV